MATTKTSQSRGKFAGSFGEQLKDTARDELGKFAGGAFDTLMGRFPTPPTSENGSLPPFGPERMTPPWQKKEKPRETMLFNFKERQENLEVRAKIQELIKEIRREIISLQQTQKSMLAEAAKITVEQLPEKPGIYHIHFLEWILKTLRDLRKKVSESASWLGVMRGKQKKMGFWGNYKKHGTQYGLSGERTAATQSG